MKLIQPRKYEIVKYTHYMTPSQAVYEVAKTVIEVIYNVILIQFALERMFGEEIVVCKDSERVIK